MTSPTLLDKDGFRPRATEVSRIEAFSDMVFGFAMTLVVVSLQVPRTYDELHAMLKGFIPFAFCFGILVRVWVRHYQFFRRFGLRDMATIWINAVLLFVVLYYVYPLKFLFTIALGASTGEVFSAPSQVRELMLLYGIGVSLLYGLIALLNLHAWRQRQALDLTLHEEMLTRSYISEAAVSAAIGLLSCGVAFLLPLHDAGYAGFTYLLLALHRPIHSAMVRRSARRLRETMHSPDAAE